MPTFGSNREPAPSRSYSTRRVRPQPIRSSIARIRSAHVQSDGTFLPALNESLLDSIQPLMGGGMGGLPGPVIIGGSPPMHPGMGLGSPPPGMGPGLGTIDGPLPGAFVPPLRDSSNLPGPPGASTRILRFAFGSQH